MQSIYTLVLAVIFGGMVTFQVLFAPIIFTKLDNKIARRFIRAFFPFYYLYFAALSACALLFALWMTGNSTKLLLALCFVGFLLSRQWLMPMANKATDNGNQRLFKKIHGVTVGINTLQMCAVAYLLF